MKPLMNYVNDTMEEIGLDMILENADSFSNFVTGIREIPPFAEVTFTKVCSLLILKDIYPTLVDGCERICKLENIEPNMKRYVASRYALIDCITTLITQTYQKVDNVLVLYGALLQYLSNIPTPYDNFEEVDLNLLKQITSTIEKDE